MNRKLILFVLVSVMVASCSSITSIPPSATPSLLVSPTAKSIETSSTPEFTATPNPTLTPGPHASNYELQPWDAADAYYLNLADEHNKDYYVSFNSDRERYGLVFQAEKLLRDPSSNWHDIAWEIVANLPKGIPLPGMRPDEDLLAFLIEDLLNNQNVKLDDLFDVIKNKTQDPWECYSAEILDSPSKQGRYLVVKNLFGDQQDGRVFYVGSCQHTAVYVLRILGNQYRVEKLRDWQALEMTAAGLKLVLNVVGDVNNNGTPEIVIDNLFGASGTPPVGRETIEFYEWNSSQEVFVSDSIEILENVCQIYRPCENGWRLEKPNAQDFLPINVREMYATMTESVDGNTVCDNLIIEHVYLWENGKFVEQRKALLLPPTDERIECQLSWSLQVLKRDYDQSEIATSIISKTLNNWPVNMNDMWGPASQDYFALRLGLFYDMIGQEDRALLLLKAVSNHPYNPDFNFASQLASTYMNVRLMHGKVKACEEINLLQDQSEFEKGPFYFVPIEMLRKMWGYGAPIWLMDVDGLCDAKLMLELLAQRSTATKFTNIDEWLTTIGMEASNIQVVYESNPLTRVWLVSLPVQFVRRSDKGTNLEREEGQQIWLFVKSSRGVSAKYLETLSQDTNKVISLDHIQLGQTDLLVFVQATDNDFRDVFILHIMSNGKIQSLLDSYATQVYIDHVTTETTLVTKSFDEDQPDITVYKWDSRLQQLDQRKINFDFAKIQNKAEEQVFQEHDFPQAIVYINEFLIQAPLEPNMIYYCNLDDCTYYPDWYRPYMRYLLALSYEMSGQKDRARDTYFALWQDYQANIFGLAAEHRLVTVKP